ncbi:MAG: TRAP transporter small permease subunit [Magnetospirillum sp.]|nr:TRAP transporter small permease subunit [Magnetospirillum sp.]
MRGLLRFSAAIDRVNAACGKVASLLVLLACLISAGNAVMRYTISYSSNAWLEIQWYLFGAMVMLGAAVTLKRGEHVRVDLVFAHVAPRTRLWIDLIGGLLFLLPTTILIGWLSWPLLANSFAQQEVSSNAGGLLRWPIKLFLPLGFLLLTLQGLSEMIKRAAALAGVQAYDPHYDRPLQ